MASASSAAMGSQGPIDFAHDEDTKMRSSDEGGEGKGDQKQMVFLPRKRKIPRGSIGEREPQQDGAWNTRRLGLIPRKGKTKPTVGGGTRTTHRYLSLFRVKNPPIREHRCSLHRVLNAQ